MKNFVLSILLFIVFSLGSSLLAETFQAGTAEWRPYAYLTETKKLEGIAVEIVMELAKRTGHTIHVELYPAKRLNQLFDENKLDMNFADSLLWNPKTRESNHVFTIHYMTVKEYLYFHKDHYTRNATIADLKGKTVGIVLGYYYPMLEQEFKSGEITKREIPHELGLLKNLWKKRVDVAVFDNILFSYLITEMGYSSKAFRRGLLLGSAPLGIKMRIEKREFLKGLNRDLIEMKTDRTIDKIVNKYIN